jgi:hypothetical protein
MKKPLIYVLFAVLTALGSWLATAYAAEISNVTITGTTASSTVINWKTDVNTDATVHYGLDSSYGVVRDPTSNSLVHSLQVSGLDPGTTYHFQVESNDAQGNKSATAGFIFTTGGTISQKINSEISKVTSPKELAKIADEVKQPAIVGSPKVVTNTTGATISWSTDRESDSAVALAPEAVYSPGGDPYTIHQGNPGDSTTQHIVEVIGLDPSTTYHFQATSQDATGLTGSTPDDTFVTKSILPNINGIKISRIQENSATVSWSTGNVLAQGLVDYTDTRSKKTKSYGDPVYTSNHTVNLTGLTLGTKYNVVVRATNKGGDEVDSKQLSFITVRDILPPVISKVNNESTLFPSDNVKIQTIITWVTDEPADCQLFYTQGLVHDASTQASSMAAETNPLTAHTQVIVGFSPGSVYKFWMQCHDIAGNPAQSDDFVLITPNKEQNIIDVILANFQGSFGWLNNVSGKK